MTNFGAKIFGAARSGLNASQAVIANSANNIANVNSEGYVKRRVELTASTTGATSGSINVGNGVDIGQLERVTSDFLERQLRAAQSEFSRTGVEDEYLSRLEPYFGFGGDFNTIGTAFNAFRDAINDLSVNPSSIELRSNFVARAGELTTAINTSFNMISDLQVEADQRIETEIGVVNSITAEIAQLNGAITARESLGQVAADERDKRDHLLNKLSEKVSFQVTEIDDGSVNISLPSGFTLVSGINSRNMEFSRTPSTRVSGGMPRLDGGTMGSIVYDYAKGTPPAQHVDFTSEIAGGDGSLAGLIRMRGFGFPDPATPPGPGQYEPFAGAGTLVNIALGIELVTDQLLTSTNNTYLGTTVAPSVPRDLQGNPPDNFGLFSVSGAATTTDGGSTPGQPDRDDLIVATGVRAFSGRLAVSFSDPARVAAALDDGAGNYGLGDGSNLTRLLTDLDSGRSFSVPGIYTLNNATYRDAYDNIVSRIGNTRNQTRLNLSVSESQVNTAKIARDEIAQVSLDEEFTQLIRFQRQFEASARLIKTGDEILQQIVNLI